MKFETFEDVERYVNENCLHLSEGEQYSLERIKNFLGKIDNPQDKVKVIHVAGTSGKTSTAYYISAVLEQGGYKVGLSVSPHIDEVNERVQISLVPLSEKQFCEELSEFIDVLESTNSELTYFELFVAFAFWYFAKVKVDYAVVEVGLGGLLDGTNVVSRNDKICVITDIGLDHQDVLGDKVENIAVQKGGIIQDGNEVFVIDQDSEVIKVIAAIAKNKKGDIHKVESSAADFQQRNFDLAKAVCDYIFSKDGRAILSQAELAETFDLSIPGRLETIEYKTKIIVLDGAHNAQKMKALLQSLNKKFADKSFAAMFAVSENKKDQLLEMTRMVDSLTGYLILTQFEAAQDRHLQSVHPDYLREYFPDRKVAIELDAKNAFKKLLEQKEDILLVTGSLYLVSEVRKFLK